MNDRPPHIERDHVLVEVKAKPFGWAYGPSLDLDSGRGPMARSGAPAPEIHKFRSLYGFRGLPTATPHRTCSRSSPTANTGCPP